MEAGSYTGVSQTRHIKQTSDELTTHSRHDIEETSRRHPCHSKSAIELHISLQGVPEVKGHASFQGQRLARRLVLPDTKLGSLKDNNHDQPYNSPYLGHFADWRSELHGLDSLMEPDDPRHFKPAAIAAGCDADAHHFRATYGSLDNIPGITTSMVQSSLSELLGWAPSGADREMHQQNIQHASEEANLGRLAHADWVSTQGWAFQSPEDLKRADKNGLSNSSLYAS